MTPDPRKPLSPLDSQVINHLTAALGPPQSCLITRQGDRDIYINAWVVGFGRTTVPADSSKVEKGIDVTIRLTAGGALVTTRCAWTRTPDGESQESQTGQVHTAPDLAYQWLVKDGKGKLGPASKEAWIQACLTVPPMNGLEFERVE